MSVDESNEHLIRIVPGHSSVKHLQAEGRAWGKFTAGRLFAAVMDLHENGLATEAAVDAIGVASTGDLKLVLKEMEAQGVPKSQRDIFDKAAGKAYLAEIRRFRKESKGR